jgi:hypothetical protein
MCSRLGHQDFTFSVFKIHFLENVQFLEKSSFLKSDHIFEDPL